MRSFNHLRKYFIYDDVLRTIVGIVTGVFIVYFNAFGGFLIMEMLYESLFSGENSGLLRFLIIIPLGMVTGYFILKLTVSLTFRLFRSDGMENYSLLRFILLLSILFYLIILALYFLFYLLNSNFRNLLAIQ